MGVAPHHCRKGLVKAVKKGVKQKKNERVYTHGSDMPSAMADARLQIGHATTMPTPFYGTTMPTCRIMLALLGGRIVCRS